MSRLFVAFCWGVGAFVLTYILVIVAADILQAIPLPDAAAALKRFAWILSLVWGVIVGIAAYHRGRPVVGP